MRRPHFCCDTDHYDEQCCSAQSTGSIARLRRFLAISLGRRSSSSSSAAPPARVPPPQREQQQQQPCQAPCLKPCNVLPPADRFPSLLSDIRGEAESSLGRPLEEVMTRGQARDGAPHGGIPSFVHAVCCHMLTHEVDYYTLVAEDWCAEDIRAALLDAAAAERRSAAARGPPALSAEESCNQATLSAGLLRLFLQELPHPLIPREVVSDLVTISKEISGPSQVGGASGSICPRVRRLLYTRLPGHNLRLLQYLAAFFHQLRTAANHNTCPVSVSDLSRILGSVLVTRSRSEEVLGCDGHRIAQMLLFNYPEIFPDEIALSAAAPSSEDAESNSDSVSSAYDSLGGEHTDTDLFTADEEGEEEEEEEVTLGGIDEDDSTTTTTTTTTDTDDLRSPLKAPLNSTSISGGRPPSPCRSRSTAEIQDVDSFRHTKIGPLGKGCLPSITDLLKSPDDSWKDEGIRSYSRDQDNWKQSCISDGDDSESDADGEYADGSDCAEGGGGGGGLPSSAGGGGSMGGGLQCPHEERRSSERSFPRSHKAPSTSRRPKRRVKRKQHAKEAPMRIQSSEEEEKDHCSSNSPPAGSCFASLLSWEEEPETFDPNPPDDNSSQPFRDLIAASASDEPVTSDRASWGGLKIDMSQSDKWHRTARHYSRYEEKNEQNNWFKEPEIFLTSKDYSAANESTSDGEELRKPAAGQAAAKLLMRNVNSIKKKIKKYEEEFERSMGYRPSHSDKMKHKDIKKYMTELNKARKELKKMKDDVAGMLNVPRVFPVNLFRCQETTDPSCLNEVDQCSKAGGAAVSTLREVEVRLREKRKCAKRPIDLNSMTADQIQDEKTALQRALLYYESLHGRPSTKEDRDLARPLYDRYRQVKRSIIRSSSRTKENLELAPILEHVVMDFTLASPQHRGSLQDGVDSDLTQQEEEEEMIQNAAAGFNNPDPPLPPPPTQVFSPFTAAAETSSQSPSADADDDRDSPRCSDNINLGDLHALPLHELKERKKEAKEEKKRLRKSLREFEERFERETARKVQKEDRGPMERTYTDYKHAKAKLRLLEALLSKHENAFSSM